MTLVEKLEKRAKEIIPWIGGEYFCELDESRSLFEQAAKRIRELEKWEMIIPPRPYNTKIRGVDRGYRNFW